MPKLKRFTELATTDFDSLEAVLNARRRGELLGPWPGSPGLLLRQRLLPRREPEVYGAPPALTAEGQRGPGGGSAQDAGADGAEASSGDARPVEQPASSGGSDATPPPPPPPPPPQQQQQQQQHAEVGSAVRRMTFDDDDSGATA
ncbi:MAG: hypothetical protein ACK4GD_12850 [Sphingomonadaceae bacterium]